MGSEIRLVLATPPDNRPLHNPNNLTAEQVGAGWRLALKGEKQPVGYQYWASVGWHTGQADGKLVDTCNKDTSIRIPLSTPWPEVEKPDPYAELKAAHKAGKDIQCVTTGQWVDLIGTPSWHSYYSRELRIKPEPTFKLPKPPPGMRWHRLSGWKGGDLPQGWRPLVKGEQINHGDECIFNNNSIMKAAWGSVTTLAGHLTTDPYRVPDYLLRTTRPLVFTHDGKDWTWHRPGDPCPCGESSLVHYLDTKGRAYGPEIAAKRFTEFGADYPWPIIGWRYADKPEPREVDLGPEDVPPMSIFKRESWDGNKNWLAVSQLTEGFVVLLGNEDHVTFEELRKEEYQINRPRHRDADGNPTLWEPCSKKVEG